LLPSNSSDSDTSAEISGTKRATIWVIKGVGIIAALGFCFSPVTTYPGILWFGASIVVGLVCIAALGHLDENFPKKHGNEGYWPKPLDWSGLANNSTDEKPKDSHIE
jgi:hypothetical protein